MLMVYWENVHAYIFVHIFFIKSTQENLKLSNRKFLRSHARITFKKQEILFMFEREGIET